MPQEMDTAGGRLISVENDAMKQPETPSHREHPFKEKPVGIDFTVKDRILRSSQGSAPTRTPNRYHLILLHSLVAIVLAYQLLFSRGALLPSEVVQLIALGLIGSIVGLVLLLANIWT